MHATKDKVRKIRPVHKKKKKKSSGLAPVIFLLMITAVISVAFLVYIKSRDMDLENMALKDVVSEVFSASDQETDTGGIKYIHYDPDADIAVGVCNGGIVKYRGNKFTAVNEQGNILWEKILPMKQPEIKSAGSYAIMADINGKDVCVMKGKKY